MTAHQPITPRSGVGGFKAIKCAGFKTIKNPDKCLGSLLGLKIKGLIYSIVFFDKIIGVIKMNNNNDNEFNAINRDPQSKNRN